MYILTSKYFPTDYWPDDYFPALPIQYTEVVEFEVAAILSAAFTVEMPVLVEMEVYKELSK